MLKNISGQKIRRQYFNIPIYMLLSIMGMIMVSWTVASIIDHTFATAEWLLDLLPWCVIAVMILFPLLVLSMLNRLFFGEVICVLNEKGLYYEDDGVRYIAWNDIKYVRYEPDMPGRIGYRWDFGCNAAYITVKPFRKNVEIELVHAPFLLLGKMKKYNPNAKYGFTKFGLVMVLFYIFAPSTVSVLVILFG